jgi:Zn-dependent peptidase ImmA (M78 family)
VKQLNRIKADVLDQVERFLELLAIFPKPPIQPFKIPPTVLKTIDSMDEIEDLALKVRKAWSLGSNEISGLIDTLEERGIIVLTTAVDESKFDGLATVVNGFPVVVVGANWPGDRQRFTLAHELGHLVLKGRLGDRIDEEAACNRFAGSFLAPRAAVIMELGQHRNRIEPREFYQLKHEYGLSMMAWLFRARDVGVITKRTAEILFRLFSAKGWRQKEPGDTYSSEKPHLLEHLVIRAHAEEMISTSKAAELVAMSTKQFLNRISIENLNASAHR